MVQRKLDNICVNFIRIMFLSSICPMVIILNICSFLSWFAFWIMGDYKLTKVCTSWINTTIPPPIGEDVIEDGDIVVWNFLSCIVVETWHPRLFNSSFQGQSLEFVANIEVEIWRFVWELHSRISVEDVQCRLVLFLHKASNPLRLQIF